MSDSQKSSKSPATFRNNSIKLELDKHRSDWHKCVLCPIGKLAYRHVFYDVDHYLPDFSRIDLLFIGEGPGQTEDFRGVAFCGRAGKLLRDAVTEAKNAIDIPIVIGYTNLIACRPCDSLGSPNRSPSAKEIINCRPRLREFVDIADPRQIVLCGRIPQLYFDYPDKMSVTLWSIYHPSYIARTGGKSSTFYPSWQKQINEIIRRTAHEIQRDKS